MSRTIQRAIKISSINRGKSGISRPDDFKIKFTPTLILSEEMDHEIAMGQLTMTYSWHNVSPAYNNNFIKYSRNGGTTWTTVTFDNGMYSYEDLNDVLHQAIERNGHAPNFAGLKYGLDIVFVLSTYKVLIRLGTNWRLDLRGSEFGELIGFDKKIMIGNEKGIEYGTRLPNITNSIDVLQLNTDAISDSLVNGVASNTLAVIPTSNLRRSYPFTFNPVISYQFSPLSSRTISRMRFYIVDSLNRPIDLVSIGI